MGLVRLILAILLFIGLGSYSYRLGVRDGMFTGNAEGMDYLRDKMDELGFCKAVCLPDRPPLSTTGRGSEDG